MLKCTMHENNNSRFIRNLYQYKFNRAQFTPFIPLHLKPCVNAMIENKMYIHVQLHRGKT